MSELVTLHLYAEDYDQDKYWQLASWCRKQGADEWTVSAITVKGADPALFLRFDEATAPYRLPIAKRRTLTARSSANYPDNFIRLTELWRFNAASLAALREALPDGLFTCESSKDGWFEDPIFYRKGELMLGIVSHEREGILRVTEQERQSLDAVGLPVHPHGTYVGWGKE